MARSTIYAVLRRHGQSRLRDGDRARERPLRYVRELPGELVHLDTKKLGRIPPGGGHRALGWERRHQTARGQGNVFLHVAVDDASRLAFAQLLPDERGESCARFLRDTAAFFAAHGIQIERILTDNARAYTDARIFQATLTQLGVRHRHTRPYRPQTNGKAERFIQTALAEWAYRRPFTSDDDRARLLPRWLRAYNHHRPHSALGGRSPLMAVNNLSGNDT
jgi:transposase InsO family protein